MLPRKTPLADFTFGDLPDSTPCSADENGNITIHWGVTGKDFEETLRHVMFTQF